jgi:hypothetical protein
MNITWEKAASVFRGCMTQLPGPVLECVSTLSVLFGEFEAVIADVSPTAPSVSIRLVDSADSIPLNLTGATFDFVKETGRWLWSLTVELTDKSTITFSRPSRPD